MSPTLTTERLVAFIAQTCERASGWRAWFDRHEIDADNIRTVDDLTRIPVLRKTYLPQLQKQEKPFGGLYAGDGQPGRIFLSPGPIYDPQPEGEDPWRFAVALQHVGFARGDIVLNTFSYHLSPAGFMFDKALRNLGATVVPTGVGNTELLVSMLRDLRANGYVGTPSYFRTLIGRAEESGLRFDEEILIKKAFFTAEPIPTDFVSWCTERGISFGEAYGTADAGCIAYRGHPEAGLQIESRIYVQICHPDTGLPVVDGEVGELVITVFDHVYPLIRFGTGDLSCWLPGQEGMRIAGILGRVGDGVKVRGMFVYRQQIDQVLAQYPSIEYYQANVTNDDGRDQLTITVEMSVEPSSERLESIDQHLRQVLRVKAELRYVRTGTLDRSNNALNDRRTQTG